MKFFCHEKVAVLLKDPRTKASGIAQVAQISVQSLYAIRDGKSVPSANTLAALSEAFQKPLEYFFEDICKYSEKEAS